MKNIIALFALLLPAAQLFAQNNALLHIKADSSKTIEIAEPIDNDYQNYHATRTVKAGPGAPSTLDFTFDDFAFVSLKWDNKKNINILLLPGDNVTLNISGNETFYGGNNAAGHKYYNDYFSEGTLKYVDPIRMYLKNNDDYSRVFEFTERSIVAPFNENLDRIAADNPIADKFITTIKEDVYIYFHSETLHTLVSLHANKTLSNAENNMIEALTDSIYFNMELSPEFVIKLPRGRTVFPRYYKALYERMSPDEIGKALRGYPLYIYGPYKSYLAAKENIRVTMMGQALVVEKIYGSMGFAPMDKAQVYDYIKTLNPASGYVHLLREYDPQSDISKKEIVFIEDQVSSLSDFTKIGSLAGKYLLIDMWATWCIFCKEEFKYKDKILDIVLSYPDLENVYISIDEEKLSSKWINEVIQFDLKGSHIRASEELLEDIKRTIFGGESILIPRYILLDPQGNVINKEMPRPGDIDGLKKELNKYIR